MKRIRIAILLCLAASAAHAQVQVTNAWIRGTVSQQTTTGAFMQIRSPADARLISASTPVAGVVELHEMRMDGNVMKMRAVTGIELPAGKAVELRPGGFHMMLLNLRSQMKAGERVPITLVVESPDRERQTFEVQAQVRPLGDPGPGAGAMRKH